MRVRHLVSERKIERYDTGWSINDLPPRHAPIFAKTRPIRAGWKWRSARAEGVADNHILEEPVRSYILTAICNPSRDNWKAFLIVETADGPSVVGRFEYHGSHPGIHIHTHCERCGIEIGGSGLDNLVRVPPAGQFHRRVNAWTEGTFWTAAKRFFRIEDDNGPLFNHGA